MAGLSEYRLGLRVKLQGPPQGEALRTALSPTWPRRTENPPQASRRKWAPTSLTVPREEQGPVEEMRVA